ncbi:hypothetical protein RJT34_31762 [Clitoria ternatea]|uniref:Uncharacterized protein n=1 Tax=Clitoria ternatea TaxID=43366 RepID=A0AAN9I1N0_CLITE
MQTCVEGSKRQLPPWMVQKVGATHGNASEKNVVETNCSVEKGDTITEDGTNKEHKREPSMRNSKLKSKCEVKGRKKLGQQDVNGDDVTQKKKKKNGDRSRERVQRSSIKKNQNLEDLSHDSCDVYPVQASSEDGVELTVEDLITIAEQYVKEHENKERQETSRQCEPKWQFQVTNETGTTPDSPCENENSSISGRETLSNSTVTTSELVATSTSQSQTYNPAQDMLDLFLGPLLRKTIEKEEKSKSIVENVEITHEITRKSQDEPTGGEIVPLMKKRNTLKDKVAMFLDQDM